mgnify:CR=1 FL=1
MYITLETEDIALGVLKALSLTDPDVPWDIEDIKRLIDKEDELYDPTVLGKMKNQIRKWVKNAYDVEIFGNMQITSVGNNTIIVNCEAIGIE